MKSTLQPVQHLGRFERLQLVEDLWDEFAAETSMETRPEVLDELEQRVSVLACLHHRRGPARWLGS